jgi:multimeric flavodoxin WrbA
MMIAPVNWFQVSSPLKLMMDRLVCAEGGNPDPTATQGKDAAAPKTIELEGWTYPRHLEGRAFAVLVHGDAQGARSVRSALVDWLQSMKLISAGPLAELDRYIGYYQPYATSHQGLDRDEAFQEETRNAARALVAATTAKREGLPGLQTFNPREPRPK